MGFVADRQDEGKVRNPYRWLPRKEEKEKKDRKKADKRPSSPSEVVHCINTLYIL